MDVVLTNALLAFLEGFALVISPCILPILPFVLVGAVTGKKSRPFGIIIGFVLSFTLVVLFTRTLVSYTNIQPEALRNGSYAILVLLGIVMLSTFLTEKFNKATAKLANIGNAHQGTNNPEGGLLSGVLFGGLIGIIWTPCAGPILAAVIVQATVQQTTRASGMVVMAFAIGVSVPMLLIALLGRRIITQFDFFRSHGVFLRKLLGLIIILSVLFLIYSINIIPKLVEVNSPDKPAVALINGLESSYPAPDLVHIDAWINSKPLQLDDLEEKKVVLIDFWTYSCINCIRTLPYLNSWYEKYHDKGLVIIGVHSPEFAFEHNLENVKAAVKKFGIKYPVALDNQFGTWQNYRNQFWPAHYLINKKGQVVYKHFGEGEYDTTENNIRYLLGLTGAVGDIPDEEYLSSLTPELYLGASRAENFSSPEGIRLNQAYDYTYPNTLPVNHWALKGKWTIGSDRITAESAGASIQLHFNAGIVYAVMGAAKTSSVKVVVPESLPVSINGKEGPTGQILVKNNQLYTVVDLKKEGDGEVELIAGNAGLEVYTFTFGS